jgi:uncharacterized protein HemY
VGRFLIVFGLVIAAVGMLISLGLPLGRLPGDLSYRRGNFSIHFPIVTSIVVSIILTLLFSFLRR